MKERGPWRTISEELKYQTDWIAVSHHEVIDPKGNNGIYGVIHFKNIAVGMLPLDEEGFTWIVGQYRYPIGNYSWEMPEGGGKRDVPTIETAKRELKEETGKEAFPVACDVRSYIEVERMVQAVVDRFGHADSLINNAAGNFISPTERLSGKAFEVIIGIVLMGSVNCTLAAITRMKEMVRR